MSIQNNQLLLDTNGYLKSTKDWNLTVAKIIAKKEHILMTPDHWKIIYFVRNFYLKYQKTPSMRMLSVAIEKKLKKKNISIYLFNLFPQGPAKQASKIAGIPQPSICL
ncbi:TusE/DsrC/DsvC family sulfur relay protein [Buchnera aphidicola (Hormaphis cornu)]|nr:TusE/DsrC/DsvC family sulfur relay protein [Buchnera aphidicola (Hormaphis cornu)]